MSRRRLPRCPSSQRHERSLPLSSHLQLLRLTQPHRCRFNTRTMYMLEKSFTFEASHTLAHHDGKCAHLHGHSYSVSLELSGPSLQKRGPGTNMLCDFAHISAAVKPVLQKHLDHQHLNDSLDTDSPTAEFIARWLYERLCPKLPLLDAVTVKETATAAATYRPRRAKEFCDCDCHDTCGSAKQVENGNGYPRSNGLGRD